MWALIVIIFLSVLGLGISIGKHGEPKGEYNAWVDVISFIITWWLLYEAGLFDKYLNI